MLVMCDLDLSDLIEMIKEDVREFKIFIKTSGTASFEGNNRVVHKIASRCISTVDAIILRVASEEVSCF